MFQVLRFILLRRQCEQSLNLPNILTTRPHVHCRGPSSQPETCDNINLFQVESSSKYSYFKNNTVVSPYCESVSGNAFTEVSSTSAAWVSLPCSHSSHPEGAFYFLHSPCSSWNSTALSLHYSTSFLT